MRDDFERIRHIYQPTIAFLPVSRMMYRYGTGGVNGYCHTVDTTLLETDFQYTADFSLAVEWVRWLGAKYVVPYGTFTFRKTEPSAQAADFADAMQRAGMGDRVIALRPLDAITARDLDGSSAAASRRAFLLRWQKTLNRVARTDRRLQKTLPYRILKRLLARKKPKAEAHH
jgi:hypothetical protein